MTGSMLAQNSTNASDLPADMEQAAVAGDWHCHRNLLHDTNHDHLSDI